MVRYLAVFAACAVAFGLATGAWLIYAARSEDRFAACRTSRVAGQATLGGPFTLTNQQGQQVTDKQVIDRLSLIYFGYSFCPDVCPLDMTRNVEVSRLLKELGVDLKPVFISIDPERDTPGALTEFAEYVDPSLVALSGTAEQTSVVAKEFGVYYAKDSEDPDYLMSHSVQSYLMHPQYGFLEFFPREIRAEPMRDTIACFAAKL